MIVLKLEVIFDPKYCFNSFLVMIEIWIATKVFDNFDVIYNLLMEHNLGINKFFHVSKKLLHFGLCLSVGSCFSLALYRVI